MKIPARWAALARRLDDEIGLLEVLLTRSLDAHEPLRNLDIGTVEHWVEEQNTLLGHLAQAGQRRTEAFEALLPPPLRGVDSGGMAGAMTLEGLARRAPHGVADRLLLQRDTLRQLRDEIAVASTRNEFLIRGVLDFTDHFGGGLARAAGEEGYDASGQPRGGPGSGDLFTSAL